jgi:hypothetical protein
VPFGIFSGTLAYFTTFWYVAPRKIWQPCTISKAVFQGEQMSMLKESPKMYHNTFVAKINAKPYLWEK